MRSVFSIAAIALLAGCATPAMGSGLAFCLSSPESNQRNLTHLWNWLDVPGRAAEAGRGNP